MSRSFLVRRRRLRNSSLLFCCLFVLSQWIFYGFDRIFNDDIPWNPPIFAQYSISCEKLFQGHTEELKHAFNFREQTRLIPDSNFIFTKNYCSRYRFQRFNETFHQNDSTENRQFPLAFNILLYENIEQFERLLRLIYRPQNFYCVHLDADASADVFHGIQSIIQCFDNVFLSSRREHVLYATFSRLQADLNCMKDLLRYPSWKYLLNVANSELPLKSNSELVKILSIYRGFNDIEGRWKTRLRRRTDFVWLLKSQKNVSTHRRHLQRTEQRKSPPPGQLEIVKGSAYGAFSRAFVEFVLTNPIAKEFLDWSRDTYSPDEHYWATLNYNSHLQAPGGYRAKSDPTNWTARFANWDERRCRGYMLRGICVFGAGDLPILTNRVELFANKFQLKFDPIAYQCVEEMILNRSRLDRLLLNESFYRQMPFLLS